MHLHRLVSVDGSKHYHLEWEEHHMHLSELYHNHFLPHMAGQVQFMAEEMEIAFLQFLVNVHGFKVHEHPVASSEDHVVHEFQLPE